MPIHKKPKLATAVKSETSQEISHGESHNKNTASSKMVRRFPLKKTLVATALTGVLACVALSIWIINTQTEKLIIRAANYVLSGMDSELIDIRLGESQLEHWHITSAKLRIHDSQIMLKDLNIVLELDWPQSLDELKQLSQIPHLTRKIKQIKTGDIEVELGQSIFLPDRNAIDEQGPALALDIKSLPQIDIGKTKLFLRSQANLPAYHLVMDKLSLNNAGEISSAFSHDGESIAVLKAILAAEGWQLESELALAPLLASLHQISLRQSPGSMLNTLTEFDKQWQELAIDLQGQLVSHSQLGLTSGELISRHKLIDPKVTFNQFAALQLEPKPALEFSIAGHLAELELSLKPFTLALNPNDKQQQQLLALLDSPLNDSISTLLSGLKNTAAPVGIQLTLGETLTYPLNQTQTHNGQQAITLVNLPQISLKTLDSKIDIQVDVSDIEIAKSADTLALKADWHLNAKQETPVQLADIWIDATQALGWKSSQLVTTGEFSLAQSPQSTDWQLMTKPVTAKVESLKKTAPTLLFSLGEITYNSPLDKQAPRQTEFNLGHINLNTLGLIQLSSHTDHLQQGLHPSSMANQTALQISLPPLDLTLDQLRLLQTTQTSVVGSDNIISSQSDMSAAAFSITLQKAMHFELKPDTPMNSLLASDWQNHLLWHANQLNIEKQLSSKGRTRKETVLKLDSLALKQSLDWKKGTLLGEENWQLGTVELQSHHQLNLATANKPLVLTGQWVVDTSMTEALSLLNQTQPLPSELNVTGNNQFQAQFNLTQQRDQTQFVMQITQSMTDLEGFYNDTIFEGGKLQAQCEFTWELSHRELSHKKPQDKDYFSSLSRLNCPQTLMTFNLFDPGFPLTDIEVEADIALGKDAEKLPDNWLQQLTGLSDTDISMTAKGKVLSGQFLLPEFNLKLQEKSHAYLLLQGMSLEEVLRIQPQTGINADGIFDGVLPVDLVNGKVSITGGQLAARAPGGLIAISGNPSVDGMRQSQPYLDFVFSTLEHLQYSQLSSSFDMDQEGDATLIVEVKGRTQGIERPIHLNYSHEENMLQLFRSLQIGNDLQNKIEKSVK
ncbi:YdbH domain-containing protein [Shewanella profunda]|uniref:YdbH domain-containing protein n=1 Tax=Shewanella profunda TaxID=254793 RepID=UPI00200BF989|nr:YdbH domain-containing protein [Shewanella profunda]MCL1089362.1 YdbH domain-containing protein [Shewanella profunda]